MECWIMFQSGRKEISKEMDDALIGIQRLPKTSGLGVYLCIATIMLSWIK